MTGDYPMRINKYIGHAGYSTRKGADVLIAQGIVFINGRRAVLGDKVNEADKVEVRQKTKTKYRYFAYNKPVGVISHSPQLGEKDIKTAISVKGVFPVGRLDKKSHGLIIVTDDARITDKLLNPDYVHDKEYRVTAKQSLPNNFKRRMESGVHIEGYRTKTCKVEIYGEKKFAITLTEGKKHQIRRMCAALSVDVEDLERVRIMNIKLGTMKSGEHREIAAAERDVFLKQLGL